MSWVSLVFCYYLDASSKIALFYFRGYIFFVSIRFYLIILLTKFWIRCRGQSQQISEVRRYYTKYAGWGAKSYLSFICSVLHLVLKHWCMLYSFTRIARWAANPTLRMIKRRINGFACFLRHGGPLTPEYIPPTSKNCRYKINGKTQQHCLTWETTLEPSTKPRDKRSI